MPKNIVIHLQDASLEQAVAALNSIQNHLKDQDWNITVEATLRLPEGDTK